MQLIRYATVSLSQKYYTLKLILGILGHVRVATSLSGAHACGGNWADGKHSE